MMNETQKPIAIWLFTMAILVALMVVIGGVTRLTGSGLSMVEWRPLIGTLPPLTDSEWLRVFTLYQDSPEYNEINYGMSLAEFKLIFFWEYFHRLWGRMLGLAFGLPLAFNWLSCGFPLALLSSTESRRVMLLPVNSSCCRESIQSFHFGGQPSPLLVL